jgi:hypothetical protein
MSDKGTLSLDAFVLGSEYEIDESSPQGAGSQDDEGQEGGDGAEDANAGGDEGKRQKKSQDGTDDKGGDAGAAGGSDEGDGAGEGDDDGAAGGTGDEGGQDDDIDFQPFVRALFDQFGWEWKDDAFKEGDLKGMGNFASWINSVVEENSVPHFENPEAQRLYEFLENGGKLEDYIGQAVQPKSFKDLDLTSIDNKKEAYREYLRRTTKFDANRIEKMVKSAIDLEEIDALATESVDYIVKDDEARKQKLLDDQKAAKDAERQKQVEKVNEVKSYIHKSDEIAGWTVDKNTKIGFEKFLTEVGEDGKTAYQRLYADNKNLSIELAFLAYKGVNRKKVAKSLESETARKIKETMARMTGEDKSVAGRRGGQSQKANQNPRDTGNYNEFVI